MEENYMTDDLEDTPSAETPVKAKRAYHRKRVLTPRSEVSIKEKPMPEPAMPKFATVIYRRQDDTDPKEMIFGGMKFKADEPVEVPYSKTILQLLAEKRETADGVRSHTLEKQVPLPIVMKGNPWFEVDGVRTERVRPHARLPEDADSYRGYCINWISVSMSADSMDKRWVGEEGLRQRCGCSAQDIGYLRPFFEARREECAGLDKMRVVA